jgi:hypothetical protein
MRPFDSSLSIFEAQVESFMRAGVLMRSSCAILFDGSVLGFNPRYIRKGLVRWKEKELSKQRRAPI